MLILNLSAIIGKKVLVQVTPFKQNTGADRNLEKIERDSVQKNEINVL